MQHMHLPGQHLHTLWCMSDVEQLSTHTAFECVCAVSVLCGAVLCCAVRLCAAAVVQEWSAVDFLRGEAGQGRWHLGWASLGSAAVAVTVRTP
jgi:hypothetical protein